LLGILWAGSLYSPDTTISNFCSALKRKLMWWVMFTGETKDWVNKVRECHFKVREDFKIERADIDIGGAC
jgi:hypothetical protein